MSKNGLNHLLHDQILLQKNKQICLPEKNFLSNLDRKDPKEQGIENDTLCISPDSVLNKNILIQSENIMGLFCFFHLKSAVSSRIWMILSQMGHRNIFILTNDTDNEAF